MGFGFAEKLIKILIENHSKIRVCFAIVLTIKFANNDFDRFFCLFLIDLAMLNAKHFLPSGNPKNRIQKSKNQRVEFHVGEKDSHLPSGKEKWNLLWRKNMKNLLDFLQQFHRIEMRQQGWLQENGNMFFR